MSPVDARVAVQITHSRAIGADRWQVVVLTLIAA